MKNRKFLLFLFITVFIVAGIAVSIPQNIHAQGSAAIPVPSPSGGGNGGGHHNGGTKNPVAIPPTSVPPTAVYTPLPPPTSAAPALVPLGTGGNGSSPVGPSVPTRQVSSESRTIFAYLQNLIAWGNQMFQQFTSESVNEAI